MAREHEREIEIPNDTKAFMKMNWKKFKKKNKEYFDSKKEMKENYFSEMLYLLADTIDYLIRFSHIDDPKVQEVKTRCYQQLSGNPESPDFIRYITKVVKREGVSAIPNMEFFPIILSEIISDINRVNAEEKEKDPEAPQFDASELYELNMLILKKKLKKAAKKGIDEDVAIDVLSVIPCSDAMKYSKFFRIKSVFDILYIHSKTKIIDFKEVIKLLIDDEWYDVPIQYALQERKEKFQKFNEKQKSFFNSITTWVFQELEDSDKSTIFEIIQNYVKTRKRDDSRGKDGNRRYFLSSLPEDEFPRICKIVEQIKNKDPEAEKYL